MFLLFSTALKLRTCKYFCMNWLSHKLKNVARFKVLTCQLDPKMKKQTAYNKDIIIHFCDFRI